MNELRKSVERAGSIENVESIVESAKSRAGTGDLAYMVYPGIFTWAMERAYFLDPDGEATQRLELAWVSAMAETDYPVQPDQIESKRAEVEYWRALRPMADRHNSLTKSAKAPAELLSIVTDVTVDPHPEMDDRFRTAALCEAYAAAWLLDADDPATRKIATALDAHAGRGVANKVAEETAKEQRRRKKRQGRSCDNASTRLATRGPTAEMSAESRLRRHTCSDA